MSNLIYSILPQPPREIVSVHPDVSITQCVNLMVTQKIGALVVTDDDNLLGMVNEPDIIQGLKRYGETLLTKTAADILCSKVAVLKPSDTVETAMAIMTETKRRYVLIAEAGQLTAIVSIGDVMLSLLGDKSRVIQALEHYINF